MVIYVVHLQLQLAIIISYSGIEAVIKQNFFTHKKINLIHKI